MSFSREASGARSSYVSSLLCLLVSLTLLTSIPLNGIFRTSSVVLAQDLDLSVLDGEAAADVPDVVTDASASDVESETGESAAESKSAGSKTQFFDLIMASGWIGLVLLLASIAAVTLVIRLSLLLRRSVFIPADLLEKSTAAVARGDLNAAYESSASSDSYLGQIMAAGLKEADRGWNAAEKALEDAVAAVAAKLYRRTEPLSVIGNVAPMLGLLGTVMGMVSTFGELAVSDGSGRNLANGIYFALVTTVAGLIVAIPVLVAHALLNGRVASLVAETSDAVEKALEPLKRRQAASLSAPRHDESIRHQSEVKSAPARSVRGLQEVARPAAAPASIRAADESDAEEKPRASARPSLSLKARRQDGE